MESFMDYKKARDLTMRPFKDKYEAAMTLSLISLFR